MNEELLKALHAELGGEEQGSYEQFAEDIQNEDFQKILYRKFIEPKNKEVSFDLFKQKLNTTGQPQEVVPQEEGESPDTPIQEFQGFQKDDLEALADSASVDIPPVPQKEVNIDEESLMKGTEENRVESFARLDESMTALSNAENDDFKNDAIVKGFAAADDLLKYSDNALKNINGYNSTENWKEQIAIFQNKKEDIVAKMEQVKPTDDMSDDEKGKAVEEYNKLYEEYQKMYSKVQPIVESEAYKTYVEAINKKKELTAVDKKINPEIYKKRLEGEEIQAKVDAASKAIDKETGFEKVFDELGEKGVGFIAHLTSGARRAILQTQAIGAMIDDANAFLATSDEERKFYKERASSLRREVRKSQERIDNELMPYISSDSKGAPLEKYVELENGKKAVIVDGDVSFMRDKDGYMIQATESEIEEARLLQGNDENVKSNVSWSRSVNAAVPSALDMVVSIALSKGMMRGASAITGKSIASMSANTPFFITSAAQQTGMFYNDNIAAGMDPDEASGNALMKGMANAIIERIGGLEQSLIKRGVPKTSIKKIKAETLERVGSGKIPMSAVNGAYLTGLQKLAVGGKFLGEQIFSELAEEIIQENTSAAIDYFSGNKDVRFTDFEDAVNIAIPTMLIAGVGGALNVNQEIKNYKNDLFINSLDYSIQNPEEFAKTKEYLLKNGLATQEQVDQAEEKIKYVKDELDTYDIKNDEIRMEVVSKIINRQNLEKKALETKNPKAKDAINKQVAKIDEEIQELTNSEAAKKKSKKEQGSESGAEEDVEINDQKTTVETKTETKTPEEIATESKAKTQVNEDEDAAQAAKDEMEQEKQRVRTDVEEKYGVSVEDNIGEKTVSINPQGKTIQEVTKAKTELRLAGFEILEDQQTIDQVSKNRNVVISQDKDGIMNVSLPEGVENNQDSRDNVNKAVEELRSEGIETKESWLELSPDAKDVNTNESNKKTSVEERVKTPEYNDKKSKAKKLFDDLYYKFKSSNILDDGFAMFPGGMKSVIEKGLSGKFFAHGMGKSTLGSAFKDLTTLFEKGIDPNRGKGMLDSVNLEGAGEAGSAIGAGSAYANGPFILVSSDPEIRNVNQIEGILVNDGLVDESPELIKAIEEMYPGIVVKKFSEAGDLAQELDSSKKDTNKESEKKDDQQPRQEPTEQEKAAEEVKKKRNRLNTIEKEINDLAKEVKKAYLKMEDADPDNPFIKAIDERDISEEDNPAAVKKNAKTLSLAMAGLTGAGSRLVNQTLNDTIGAENVEKIKALLQERNLLSKELTPTGVKKRIEEAKEVDAKVNDFSSTLDDILGADFSVSYSDQHGFDEEIVETMDKLAEEGESLTISELFDSYEEQATSDPLPPLEPRTDGNTVVSDVPRMTVEEFKKKYKGVPMLVTISDDLRVGDVVDPLTGAVITDLKGGVLFPWSEGNENSSWAYLDSSKAKTKTERAEKIYDPKKHKDGKVPMVVVKMGPNALFSNEAVWRVIAERLLLFPKQNRINAYPEIVKSITEKFEAASKKYKAEEAKVAKKNAKLKPGEKAHKVSQSAENAYKDTLAAYNYVINNGKTGDPLLNLFKNVRGEKGINAKQRSLLIDQIMIGSDVDVKGDPDAYSSPSTTFHKKLFAGVDKNKVGGALRKASIFKLLRDPLLENAKLGDIVSVVEIDKNAPEFDGNHPNYPGTTKGKGVALLDTPVNIMSVFGDSFAGALRQAIEKPNEASIKNISNWGSGAGVYYTLKTLVGAMIKSGNTDVDSVVGFMRMAFPYVQTFTDRAAWNEVMKRDDAKKHIAKGRVIYGVTVDGKIYLNPDFLNIDTAIHEMGHVWVDHIAAHNHELYQKGLKLVEGTKELQKAQELYGDTERARKEALAMLIGKKGQITANSAKESAAKRSKAKAWLESFYNYLQKTFPNLRKLKPKQIEKLTLDQFIGGALQDLFSGQEISESQKITKGAQFDTVVSTYENTGFISVEKATEIALSNDPSYLGRVARYIEAQTQKLLSGNIPVEDVVKSYIVTLASIGVDSVSRENAESRIGPIDDAHFEANGKIRGEGLAAAFFDTKEGKRFIENAKKNKLDDTDRENLRKAFVGNANKESDYSNRPNKIGRLMNDNLKPGQYNLSNIGEWLDILKSFDPATEADKIFDHIGSLRGIGASKVGFMGNFIGVPTGVIDSREIKGWLTGSALGFDLNTLSEEQQKLYNGLNTRNDKKAMEIIMHNMKQVGLNLGFPEGMAQYLGHHALWDAFGQTRTQHNEIYRVVTGIADFSVGDSRLDIIMSNPDIKKKLEEASPALREKLYEVIAQKANVSIEMVKDSVKEQAARDKKAESSNPPPPATPYVEPETDNDGENQNNKKKKPEGTAFLGRYKQFLVLSEMDEETQNELINKMTSKDVMTLEEIDEVATSFTEGISDVDTAMKAVEILLNDLSSFANSGVEQNGWQLVALGKVAERVKMLEGPTSDAYIQIQNKIGDISTLFARSISSLRILKDGKTFAEVISSYMTSENENIMNKKDPDTGKTKTQSLSEFIETVKVTKDEARKVKEELQKRFPKIFEMAAKQGPSKKSDISYSIQQTNKKAQSFLEKARAKLKKANNLTSGGFSPEIIEASVLFAQYAYYKAKGSVLMAKKWYMEATKGENVMNFEDVINESEFKDFKTAADEEIASLLAKEVEDKLRNPKTTKSKTVNVLAKAIQEVRNSKSKKNPVTPKSIADDIRDKKIKIDELLEAKKIIENNLDEDNTSDLEKVEILKEIDDAIEFLTGKMVSKRKVRKAINDATSDLDRKIGDLIADRLLSNQVKSDLVTQLMEELDLDAETAKIVAAEYKKVFDEVIGDEKKKQIEKAREKLVGQNLADINQALQDAVQDLEDIKNDNTLTPLEKGRKIKEAEAKIKRLGKLKKSAKNKMDNKMKNLPSINKMMELVQSGVFNDRQLANEFSEFFNINKLTPENQKKMAALIEKINNAKYKADKTRANREFLDFMEEISKELPAPEKAMSLLMGYMYMNMLSSPESWTGAIGGMIQASVMKHIIPDGFNALFTDARRGLAVLRGSTPSQTLLFLKAMGDGFARMGASMSTVGDAVISGKTDNIIFDADSRRLKSTNDAHKHFLKVFNDAKMDARNKKYVHALAKYIYSAWPVVQILNNRALLAADIMGKAFMTPYLQNRMVLHELMAANTDSSYAELAKGIDEAMGRNNSLEKALNEEQAQLESEGVFNNEAEKKSWREKRKFEIMQDFADQNSLEEAQIVAQELAMQGEVYGIIGALVNPLISWKQKAMRNPTKLNMAMAVGLTLVLPFARVGGIGMRLMASATPFYLFQTQYKQTGDGEFERVGVGLRKARHKYKNPSTGVVESKPLNSYELITMYTYAIAPTVVSMLYLATMLDTEEDEDGNSYFVIDPNDGKFRITGGGKSFGYYSGYFDEDYQPASFQIKGSDGKWHTMYNYKNDPTGILWSFIGGITDKALNKGRPLKLANTDALMVALVSSGSYVSDFGWASVANMFNSIGEAIDENMKTSDDPYGKKKYNFATKSLFKSSTRALIPGGGLATWAEKVAIKYGGKEAREGNDNLLIDAIDNNFLFSSFIERRRVDFYGYPYEPDLNNRALLDGSNYILGLDSDDRPPEVKALQKFSLASDFAGKGEIGYFYPNKSYSLETKSTDYPEYNSWVIDNLPVEYANEMTDLAAEYVGRIARADIEKINAAKNPKDMSLIQTEIMSNAKDQAWATVMLKHLSEDPMWPDDIDPDFLFATRAEIVGERLYDPTRIRYFLYNSGLQYKDGKLQKAPFIPNRSQSKGDAATKNEGFRMQEKFGFKPTSSDE